MLEVPPVYRIGSTPFRVDHDSILVIERGSKLSDKSKVKLWQPHIAPSLTALQQENKATGRSLGIIKPDAGNLRFFHRSPKPDEQQDAQGMQASLFEKPLRPLTPPEFVFGYKYTSARRAHTNTLQDWEVQAAYLAYLKRYGTREEALRMLAEEYGERIPTRHPHFIMGTMKLHPRTFILIGLLRTSVDSRRARQAGHAALNRRQNSLLAYPAFPTSALVTTGRRRNSLDSRPPTSWSR